jgi:hypothetical protein
MCEGSHFLKITPLLTEVQHKTWRFCKKHKEFQENEQTGTVLF